jgi:hypothetical protein
MKAGLAGEATANQILPLPDSCFLNDIVGRTGEEYYMCYCPLMQQLLNYISHDPVFSERRVIVIFDSGLYIHRPLQDALTRIFLEVLPCQAVTFISAMQVVGMSLILPSREATSLVVYLTGTEAQCIISSSHQALGFTYHSTGTRPNDTYSNNNQRATTLLEVTSYWASEEGATQVVVAILKCLDACPRPLRRDAIHNLYFCGIAANDAISIRIAKRLQSTLIAKDLSPMSSETSSDDSPTTASNSDFVTSLPIAISNLQALADLVSVVALPDSIRPDSSVWMGASLWASRLQKQQSEVVSSVQWTTRTKA